MPIARRIECRLRQWPAKLLADRGPLRIIDIGYDSSSQIHALLQSKIRIQSLSVLDLDCRALNSYSSHVVNSAMANRVFYHGTDDIRLRFRDNFFDAAILSSGMNANTRLPFDLSEIWRILKPESLLIFVEFMKPAHLRPGSNFKSGAHQSPQSPESRNAVSPSSQTSQSLLNAQIHTLAKSGFYKTGMQPFPLWAGYYLWARKKDFRREGLVSAGAFAGITSGTRF